MDAEIDRTYVSRLERGLENPTVAVLERLATAVDAQILEFFRDATSGRTSATTSAWRQTLESLATMNRCPSDTRLARIRKGRIRVKVDAGLDTAAVSAIRHGAARREPTADRAPQSPPATRPVYAGYSTPCGGDAGCRESGATGIIDATS